MSTPKKERHVTVWKSDCDCSSEVRFTLICTISIKVRE